MARRTGPIFCGLTVLGHTHSRAIGFACSKTAASCAALAAQQPAYQVPAVKISECKIRHLVWALRSSTILATMSIVACNSPCLLTAHSKLGQYWESVDSGDGKANLPWIYVKTMKICELQQLKETFFEAPVCVLDVCQFQTYSGQI